jgi:hypothetical protein
VALVQEAVEGPVALVGLWLLVEDLRPSWKTGYWL